MTNRIFTLLIIFILLSGCEKEGYNYDKYLNGNEIIYPGKVTNLYANPGDLRVQLAWNPGSDRSIVRYVIYYNSNRDSLIVPANGETTSDTIKAIVPGLREYVQDFTLYTFDHLGNRSVGQVLTAVKVFGPLYQSTLRNRQAEAGGFDGSENLIINLSLPLDTINVSTKFTYKTTENSMNTIFAHPDSTRIVIPNWKEGENILVQSAYLPVKNAIDTFWVSYSDTLKAESIPLNKK